MIKACTCNLINQTTTTESYDYANLFYWHSQRCYWLLYLIFLLLFPFVFTLVNGYLKKKEKKKTTTKITPNGCLLPACLQSAVEGSVSPSLVLPLLSFSSSLSTMAITQFKLFPTLAHTLSWKEHSIITAHYWRRVKRQKQLLIKTLKWRQITQILDVSILPFLILQAV